VKSGVYLMDVRVRAGTIAFPIAFFSLLGFIPGSNVAAGLALPGTSAVSAAVDGVGARQHRHATAILVDAQGRCPLQLRSGLPSVCRTTRVGNAASTNFRVPLNRWGVTYAFNCGRTKGDFYVLVGLPTLDGQLPETGFDRRGRTGRGYYMETGRATASWKALPVEWRYPENLIVSSTCAFHVRAVVGSVRVVARYIPAVPSAR
jgi:hypothetical protein